VVKRLIVLLALIGCTKEVTTQPEIPKPPLRLSLQTFVQDVKFIEGIDYDVYIAANIKNLGTVDKKPIGTGILDPLDENKPTYKAVGQIGLLDPETGYTTFKEVREVIKPNERLHFLAVVRFKWLDQTPYYPMVSFEELAKRVSQGLEITPIHN